MTEKEKVIDDLQEQIAWIRDNDFHKFPGWGHVVLAMRDAIALLQAQEPLKPIRKVIGYGWRYFCGKCGNSIVAGQNFCQKCGQAVKWE